jgi:cytidylate kinase
VNDGLKALWPQRVQEEKVLVLDSDAAAYILKAATALKVFYKNVIHFGLQRVAEEVRSNFSDVNKLISSTIFFL